MHDQPRPEGLFRRSGPQDVSRVLGLVALALSLVFAANAHSAVVSDASEERAITDFLAVDASCGTAYTSEVAVGWYLWSFGLCDTDESFVILSNSAAGLTVRYRQFVDEPLVLCGELDLPRAVLDDFPGERCLPRLLPVELVMGDFWAETRPRSIPWGRYADIKVPSWSTWGGERETVRASMHYREPGRKVVKVPARFTVSGLDTCGSTTGRYYLKSRLEFRRKADRRKWRYMAFTQTLDCEDAPYHP